MFPSQAENYIFCNTCNQYLFNWCIVCQSCYILYRWMKIAPQRFQDFAKHPKWKGRSRPFIGSIREGKFSRKDKHCSPILKAKFTFVSSFQVSFDENSIYITLGFLVYIVERNKKNYLLKKIKLTSQTLSLSYQLLLNWYTIHQLLHTKFRGRH